MSSSTTKQRYVLWLKTFLNTLFFCLTFEKNQRKKKRESCGKQGETRCNITLWHETRRQFICVQPRCSCNLGWIMKRWKSFLGGWKPVCWRRFKEMIREKVHQSTRTSKVIHNCTSKCFVCLKACDVMSGRGFWLLKKENSLLEFETKNVRDSWKWLMTFVAEQTSLIYQKLDTCLIAFEMILTARASNPFPISSDTLFVLQSLKLFLEFFFSSEPVSSRWKSFWRNMSKIIRLILILMNCRLRQSDLKGFKTNRKREFEWK